MHLKTVIQVFAGLGAAGLLAGAGTLAFLLGGFYDVAADREGDPLLSKFLIRVRETSIARHATDTPSIDLGSAAVVWGGRRIYSDLGCTSCHGGFGTPPARFSEGLDPRPNLKTAARKLTPSEKFWVLKHGIRMTAMPSFGSGPRSVSDQELWSIVALLEAVPTLSEDDLRTWMRTHHDQS